MNQILEQLLKLNEETKDFRSLFKAPSKEELSSRFSEYLKNLDPFTKELYLNNNNIQDISPLENLTGLKVLDLYNNKIQDLSPLENLTGLELLRLYSNNIQDISPLRNLTKLRWLNLSDNNIQDVSPLENLTKLGWLDLRNNPISKEQVENLRRTLRNCKILI